MSNYTGKLSLNFETEHYRFDSICSLAERLNPKRQFMFVSKVIGRYTPTPFSILNSIAKSLSEQIESKDLEGENNKISLLSLAETGLGLGYLVHNQLSKDWVNILRLQTTRRTLSAPVLAEFVEPHSHFPNHYIYKSFDKSVNEHLEQTNTLIIVDDEVTTGNTIKNLVESLKEKLPCLRKVIVLSLTDWSSNLTVDDVELKTYSLVKGTYTWEQDSNVPVPHLPYKKSDNVSLTNVTNDHFRLPSFDSLSDIVSKCKDPKYFNSSDIQIYMMVPEPFGEIDYFAKNATYVAAAHTLRISGSVGWHRAPRIPNTLPRIDAVAQIAYFDETEYRGGVVLLPKDANIKVGFKAPHSEPQGVVRVLAETGKQFAAREMATPAMGVTIEAGLLMDGTVVVAQNVTGIGAPSANPRIDRIYFDLNLRQFQRVVGAEAATPTKPALPFGVFPVCSIYMTVGQTSIVNANITDERTMIAAPAAFFAGDGYTSIVDTPITNKPTVLLTITLLVRPVRSPANRAFLLGERMRYIILALLFLAVKPTPKNDGERHSLRSMCQRVG